MKGQIIQQTIRVWPVRFWFHLALRKYSRFGLCGKELVIPVSEY
jgi:hypothetical protein